MSKKQIIIDGVDVSGCKHLYKEIDCLAHIDFSECCEGYNPSYGYCPNTDCYYKQLARKEQENKKLKEDEKSLLNIIDDLQKEKNKWVEKYNDLGQDFDQLKQTLAEIKEIAEKQVKRAPDGETFARPEIKQILQKICEVENE